MSIIYDALKKVEQKKGTNTKRIPVNNTGGIVISIVAALGIWLLLFSPSSPLKQAHTSRQEKGVPPAPAEKTSAAQQLPTGFVLEGILNDGQTPLAIINGTVLAENESIDGYRVANITSKSVQLIDSQNNRKITLTF